jgi:P pilus assembly chaperone PapD
MKREFLILAGLFLAAAACGASVVVMGPLVQEHTIQPGTEAAGSFEVYNPEDRPQEVKIYQTDHFPHADGGVVYGEPGLLPRSNARWISYTPQRLVLPPHEKVKIAYTVRAPGDASLRGTYWSVLMVEGVPESSPESVLGGSSQPQVAIRQVLRYAIQVISNVGSGARELKFSGIRLLQQTDKRVLAVEMENTGEQMLTGKLWTELYDKDGKLVTRLEAEPKRMYPGASARFTVDLVGLQEVTYKALVVVDCGGDDVFGASVKLVLGR